MATLEEVVSGIKEEIEHQDQKYGTAGERNLSNDDYFYIVEAEMDEVGIDLLNEDREHARLEMLQAITVGVQWLMRHGVERREDHA